MKRVYFGLGVGLSMFILGEIYCFKKMKADPHFPMNENFIEHTQNFLTFYCFFLFSFVIVQYYASKLMEYIYDKQYSVLQTLFLITSYVFFTFITPAYILYRLMVVTLNGDYSFFVISFTTYSMAWVVILIRKRALRQ